MKEGGCRLEATYRDSLISPCQLMVSTIGELAGTMPDLEEIRSFSMRMANGLSRPGSFRELQHIRTRNYGGLRILARYTR